MEKLRLPTDDELLWLSRVIQHTPITRRELLRLARKAGYKKECVNFLRQFPDKAEFVSRADFLERAEALKVLIENKTEGLPQEVLLSPQE
jgi:hypothetical protein